MSWPRQPLTPAPIAVSKQLALMCEFVDKKFCQPRGGVTKQMESMWHLWEYILNALDTPSVLICPTGEKLRPFGSLQESDRMARADREWTVVILYGHGFTNLMQTEQGVPAGKETLCDSIEALRDTFRVLAGISEEFPVHYGGWQPLPAVARPGTANVFVAGAMLTFSTANDLPEVSRTLATD